MNAILVDEFYPDPTRDSGSIDILNYMEALQALGHRPTLLTTVSQDSGVGDSPLHGLSFPSVPAAQIENWIIQNGKSVQVAFIARPGPALEWLPLIQAHAPQAAVIYLTVDLHFLRLEREALLLGHSGRLQEAQRARLVEMRHIRRSDLSVVVSSFERDYLGRVDPALRVAYVPLFRRHVGTSRGFQDRPKRAVFIGGYQHGPNQDAAHFLADTVCPIIQELDPSVEVVLAGSNMPEAIMSLSGHGIRAIGHVPNLQMFFEEARISVAPLRFGAGQKGKVLSSLSHGLPVVCTPLAAEGMFDDTVRGIRLAEDARGLAREIVELCNDESAWNELSAQAQAFARERDTRELPACLASLIERAKTHKAAARRKPSFDAAPPSEPLVSILLLTRDGAMADQTVVRSWVDQVRASRHTELLVLNAGQSVGLGDDHPRVVEILGIEDGFARTDEALARARGSFIRFASDDDPVLSSFVQQLEEQALKLGRDRNASMLGDFVLFSQHGVSICEQTYHHYPQGVESYSQFVNSYGSTPAFYAVFPRWVVRKWSTFCASHPVPFSYKDWLLTLLAFAGSRMVHPGQGVMTSHYDVSNWADRAASELRNLQIAVENGVPPSCLPLINLFWILDAVDLLSSAELVTEHDLNGFASTVVQDQIKRFVDNLEYRIKLIQRISDRQYIAQIATLSRVIDANNLDLSVLRSTMHDLVLGLEGCIPPALQRYFHDRNSGAVAHV